MPFRMTLALALVVSAPLHAEDKLADWRKVVQTVGTQGRGTAAGRAAWDKLSMAGPELLPVILEAMPDNDTVAANWLRTAFDQIGERALRKDRTSVDADGLLAFAKDARRPGRARRLALETVERVRPGVSLALYRGWLQDPEFRYEAVAEALKMAKALEKSGPPDQLAAAYRQAFDASRDVQQAREAAAALQKLGVQVSVAVHLGFLLDWYVIGPFDGMGMKGFHVEYSPEKKVTLTEELDGQNGKVRWKRYRVKEAAPNSGAKHQALANLRDKDAVGDADDAVAFAYSAFTVPAAQTVEFRGAADDNLTVWVNGVKVFGFEEWRNGVRLDRHRFPVQLKAGTNRVLVKICQTPAPNPEPNWEFFLRVVDATGKGIVMEPALGKVNDLCGE
jgi:hypothetical protein